MSLQRGENIRGWEAVTKNLATNSDERHAWRISILGMLLVIFVTGLVGLLLSQTDIPIFAKALLAGGALLGTLVLMSGVYSTMVARAKAKDANSAQSDAEAAAIAAERQRAEAAERARVAAAAEAEAARQRAAEIAEQERAEAERQRAAEAARAAEAEQQAAAEAERQRAAEAERQAAAESERQRAAEAERQAAAESERQRAAEAERQAAAERQRLADEEAARAEAAKTEAPSGLNVDRDGDGVIEGRDEGVRPTALDGARDGKPDDLKLIKGIGPKLEKVCNELGFYHFDQIAAWTSDEVAWVDSNLEGFFGRVTRDEWVAQAKILATGGETEFSKRQED